MLKARRNIHHIAAIHAIGNDDRTAQIGFTVTMLSGGPETVFPRTTAPGIQHGCIKDKGFCTKRLQPLDDFPCKNRRQKTAVPFFTPVKLDADSISLFEGMF
jgi:hypothetical protein